MVEAWKKLKAVLQILSTEFQVRGCLVAAGSSLIGTKFVLELRIIVDRCWTPSIDLH
jgi:hypothetical protein